MDYKQVQRVYKKMAKQICTLKLNGCSCENEYVLPKELPVLHITQTGINRYIEKENAIYISLSEVNIMCDKNNRLKLKKDLTYFLGVKLYPKYKDRNLLRCFAEMKQNKTWIGICDKFDTWNNYGNKRLTNKNYMLKYYM